MRSFEYLAVDAGGRRIAGNALASSEQELDRQLESRGLVLTRALASGGRDGRARLGRDERIDLTAQLATLYGNGVTLPEALSGIARRQERPEARRLVESLVHSLSAGESLSAAMSHHGTSFPPPTGRRSRPASVPAPWSSCSIAWWATSSGRATPARPYARS